MRPYRKLLAALFVGTLFVSACAGDDKKDDSKEEDKDQEARGRESNADIADLITQGTELRESSQPIPIFPFSQEYQTLLDILTVRATGTHGTYYLRNLQGDVIEWCPTQGGPIPSTYQSTPSQQYVDIERDSLDQKFPVDLPEPTGVIPGDSSATWVLCLDDEGRGFPLYFEPAGQWVGATVNYPASKRVTVDELTYRFATNEEEARANYEALCADEIIVECG